MEKLIEKKAFILLLVIVSLAFIWLLLPYYSAVFWGAILALLFSPLKRRLEAKLKGRRNLAALITLMVCLVIVIIPVIAIAGSLVQEGTSLYQRIRSGNLDLGMFVEQARMALPSSAKQLLGHFGVDDFSSLREKLSSGAMQGSQLVASQAVNIGQNTLHFMVSFGVMLYLLFFLLRDGPQLASKIKKAIPLSERHKSNLLSKFIAVTRATVKGNIIVAATQGAIGGMAFWALGIEGALLWGVLMAFLSLIPAVGAALVWLPVAIYFLLTGAHLEGIVLIIVGVFAIGLVDNLLRPILVGKDTKMPDYVVLISTLGGMSLFGLNGFVIGPLIAALFIAAWTLFSENKGNEQES
ncbi:AI-2E family transporter [Phytohalomonas tamaricis]|uniref:AI-2E family transporter n=1 Tax=Phytohalomonas tamaricis TaxID=2081032 RepID=UPI000D0AC452|nr:AI-2E family transporter [Phytohalomonas tamaricis]